MQKSISQIQKQIGRKVNPATFKKAIISAVHVSQGTGDVYMADNRQNIIRNIPFAKTVNVATVQTGAKCRVDVFDETNPNDMVIAYTYGGSNMGTLYASNVFTVTTSGNAIPHGLNTIPKIVGFIKETSPNHTGTVSGGGGGSYIQNIDVYEYQPADSTNIYLQSVNASISVHWFAIKF